MLTAPAATASRVVSVAVGPAPCQLCGCARFTPLLDVADANFSSRIHGHRILRCLGCELAVMDPFPTSRDIDELYVGEGVFSKRVPNPYTAKPGFRLLEPLYQKYGTDLRFIALQCLELAAESKPAVLDIGCSIGRLLNAFTLARPELDASRLNGIDIDPNAKSNAIAHFKERIVIADVLEHDFGQRFDVVTMRFVVEHLLDFQPYVERALALLNPGGVLFISTPDIDAPQARQLGAHWKLINDPQHRIGHLRWFNRKSMQFLAARYGLRIERTTNRGELLYHLPLSLQSLLRRLLGAEPTTGRFIKHYIPRILNATFLDGMLSQALSHGDGMYVFMRKG